MLTGDNLDLQSARMHAFHDAARPVAESFGGIHVPHKNHLVSSLLGPGPCGITESGGLHASPLQLTGHAKGSGGRRDEIRPQEDVEGDRRQAISPSWDATFQRKAPHLRQGRFSD